MSETAIGGILSDSSIIERLGRSIIIIPQPSQEYISGVSVDLRLNNVFLVPFQVKVPFFDVGELLETQDYLEKVIIPFGESFIIHPSEFALASTYEYLEVPNDLIARIEGRSSLGRLGLIVHATAARVDPGFKGRLIFELSNVGKVPVALYPLTRVASIEFHKIIGEVTKPYAGKYLAQDSTLGTRIFQDKDLVHILRLRDQVESKKRSKLSEVWGKDLTKKLWISKYELAQESKTQEGNPPS